MKTFGNFISLEGNSLELYLEGNILNYLLL